MARRKFSFLLSSLILAIACSSCNQLIKVSQNNTQIAAENSRKNAEDRGNRLDSIEKRGKLICGINEELPGFSYKEQNGSYTGLSVDLCRAIAVVIFNDPTKVEFRHLNSQERFNAVTSGKVDILSRNTTWNLTRDTAKGLDFPPTNFYDGQGLLVPQNSDIEILEDLYGKSVCVAINTTAEANLVAQMRKNNIPYNSVSFENPKQTYQAYESGECDAVTGDRSELVAANTISGNPQRNKLLDLVFSKEPLGPVIANGEPEWFDVVEWVSYATIKAEELGINSQNVDRFDNTNNPTIRRFLGMEGNLGKNIGLSNDFARKIVKQVGNYGEIYDRNIGKPFGLDRGANNLVKNGGLLQSPPFR